MVAQAECLEEVAEFIVRYGIDYSSEKEMKLIARMADNASKNIRENALKVLGEAFKHLEDNIWRVIGDITPKVQGLLEQRFKKIRGGPVQPQMQTLQPSSSVATIRPPTGDSMNLSVGMKSGGQQQPQKRSMMNQ